MTIREATFLFYKREDSEKGGRKKRKNDPAERMLTYEEFKWLREYRARTAAHEAFDRIRDGSEFKYKN